MATLPPFQQLLDEHGHDVLGFLVASVGPHDAEDLFQETLISALRSYPRLGHARNLRSWLLTIAHNKAIDHHRAGSRRALPSGGAEEVGRQRGAPDVAIEAASNETDIWRIVGTLPTKQRSAVLLRFAGDMSYTRIGELLDSSADAARRSVHEGLKKLRGELR